MPTPDRRPRGHNRRAQQRRQDESQGTLLQRINAATLPLRQRLGQGMSGLGQRNKEPKAASFKLASPLPRKHTIGLLVLIPLWLLVLAWEPAPAAPTTAPSGSLAVPLAVPAQALTVGNAGEPQAAKPVEEKVDGTWLQHDILLNNTSAVLQISMLWVYGISYMSGTAIAIICISNLVRLALGQVDESELIDVQEEGLEAHEIEKETDAQEKGAKA